MEVVALGEMRDATIRPMASYNAIQFGVFTNTVIGTSV